MPYIESMEATEDIESNRNNCGPRAAATAHLRTYGIASFGAGVRSTSFDFARLEDRLHASVETSHRHDFYQIVWVTEGRGSHVIDWSAYPICNDVVFCTAPGQVHSWNWHAARRRATGYVLNFSVEFAYRCMQQESGTGGCPRLMQRGDTDAVYLEAAQSLELREILEQLQQEYEGDALARSSAVQAYLELFLIHLERYLPASLSSKGIDSGAVLTQRLRTFVDEQFSRRLSVHEYAMMLDVSESHLCHTVRKRTGMTASRLIQERVLVEAKRLLVHGGASVSDVGAVLGFDDPAYFSRLFKKHTGQSPKEFRLAFEKASFRASA